MSKDKLRKYDFEEVLKAIGIEKVDDIYNIQQLKKLAKKLGTKYKMVCLSNIQDAIKICGFNILRLEKEKKELLNNRSLEDIDEITRKQIEIIDNEIQRNTIEQQQLYDKKENFHETTEVKMNEYLKQIENGANNSLQILYHIMIIKYNLIKQLTTRGKNENLYELNSDEEVEISKSDEISLKEKEIIFVLYDDLKMLDEFSRYIYDNMEIMQKTDWNNRNLSSKVWKPKYLGYDTYTIIPKEVPEKFLDCKIDGEYIHVLNEQGNLTEYKKLEYDERIRAYIIGDFHYRTMMDNNWTTQIIAVCKENEEKNLKIYNGVIHNINQNYIINEPEFYAKIVFSDTIMQNAKKNNCGYIGEVRDEGNSKRLIYTSICLGELLQNLYIANHVEDGRMMEKSLPAFYSHMDNIILMQIEKERQFEQDNSKEREEK